VQLAESPRRPLREVLAELALEARRGPARLQIRVERLDGETIRGELVDPGAAVGVGAFVSETQTVAVVPFDAVRRLWVAETVKRRHRIFLGAAALAGATVAVLASQLAHDPIWPGSLLGAATTLAVLLAAWTLPPIRSWLVAWRLLYEAGDA
jgi:hypothetical protein